MIEKVNVDVETPNMTFQKLQALLPDYMEVVSRKGNTYVVEVTDPYDAIEDVTEALNDMAIRAYVWKNQQT